MTGVKRMRSIRISDADWERAKVSAAEADMKLGPWIVERIAGPSQRRGVPPIMGPLHVQTDSATLGVSARGDISREFP